MINLLLKEISHINQTHDLVSKKTGVNFNIVTAQALKK